MRTVQPEIILSRPARGLSRQRRQKILQSGSKLCNLPLALGCGWQPGRLCTDASNSRWDSLNRFTEPSRHSCECLRARLIDPFRAVLGKPNAKNGGRFPFRSSARGAPKPGITGRAEGPFGFVTRAGRPRGPHRKNGCETPSLQEKGLFFYHLAEKPGYSIAQLDEIDPVDYPCGKARRAFTTPDNDVATVHVVDISAEPRAHYHKKTTEIYVVLEGCGNIELDGRLAPVRPLSSVLIRPGTRHRAVGKLRILNIPIPAFDPGDEWLL